MVGQFFNRFNFRDRGYDGSILRELFQKLFGEFKLCDSKGSKGSSGVYYF